MTETRNEASALIEKMSIEEIVNHKHFRQLKLCETWSHLTIKYWEILFETKDVGENGLPLTFFGKEINTNRYVIYKQRPHP